MVRRTKFRALGGSRMYNEAIRGRQNGNPGREDAMNAGKQPRRIRGHALGFRAVVVAPSPERKVALPAIGQDNAAGRHGVLDDRDERHRRHILHGCQANSPGPLASDFNRTDHTGFLAVAPPAATPANLQAAHVGLVDFHRSRDAVALGSDHRGSQPLEQRPCGLVAAQPQLALKLTRRNARCVRRDEVGRPKPQRQGHPRAMQNRSGGHRCLMPAGLALEHCAGGQLVRFGMTAPGATEPVQPPRRCQVPPAGIFGREGCGRSPCLVAAR